MFPPSLFRPENGLAPPFCGEDAAGEAALRGLLWPNGMQYEIGIPSLKSHLLLQAPLQG